MAGVFIFLSKQDEREETQRAESLAQKERQAQCVKLVLYTATWCPACKMAKSRLNKDRISYREYAVDIDPQSNAIFEAKAKQQKFQIAYPTYEVNGRLLRYVSSSDAVSKYNICKT